MKFLSTSAMAKKLGIPAKALFERLLQEGMVEKDGEAWLLTDKGKEHGGEYRNSQYGRYIAWAQEETAEEESKDKEESTVAENKESYNVKFLTATAIAKTFGVASNKMNLIFAELGWLHKKDNGWVLTYQGEMQGGMQVTDKHGTATPYVMWHPDIINSKILKGAIAMLRGVETTEVTPPVEVTPPAEAAPPEKNSARKTKSSENNFREKFSAKHRATDGHFVRSKAEMLIDNWLYMADIAHAYERKLPIEEEMYCDFYIPSGKVYIEYWGYENDAKYIARKKEKLKLYKKYNLNLIELQDKDVQNLDDILPQLLIKYDVKIH